MPSPDSRETDSEESRLREADLPEGQLYQLGWAFYLLLALAGILWVGLREGEIRMDLFFSSSTWMRDVALGVGSAGVLLLLWYGLDRVLPLARALKARLRSVVGPLDSGEALGLALLSGFSEEFFFRGAVQGSWGWLIATVLFAALHTGRERSFWVWTVFACVAGLLFAWLTLSTGNLLAPILGHALLNAVSLRQLGAEGGSEETVD